MLRGRRPRGVVALPGGVGHSSRYRFSVAHALGVALQPGATAMSTKGRRSADRGEEGSLPAPAMHAAGKPRLRVLGTPVTLVEPIRAAAAQELGIELLFDIKDGVAAQQQAVMHPDDFDVYDQWFNSLDLVWSSRSVQAIETARIKLWGEVNDLAKTGRLQADARMGRGSAPFRKLYVQANGELGPRATPWISMLPTVHNVDSFSYNADLVPRGRPYDTESWGWLLDERWKGRVALVSDPAIGPMDAALAVQAAGLATFEEIGNMTLREIDVLIDVLIRKKRAGHFGGFWGAPAESERLMATGAVVMESMWSPAVTALRGKGLPIVEASPREGYRAWHGGLCISAHADGRARDAAYDYMNWWLSGWAGAVMARQGYYISVPKRVKPHLSPEEWDFWYEGRVAEVDMRGPSGDVIARKGEARNGGSYWRRVGNIAVWNSAMDEHNYLVRRWNEFLSA
jgi:putative spermidine/putrescine transport system substrate-binding protein